MNTEATMPAVLPAASTMKLLPAPSKFNVNYAYISKIAEEIHPDCWDLAPIEEGLLQSYINYFGTECECDYCSEGDYSECESEKVDLPKYRLIIKFPVSTVRNSEGDSMVMRDMHIAIFLDSTLGYSTSRTMLGLRTTCTTKEYAWGFMFSHANNGNRNDRVERFFVWRSLCLGGDTELTDIMYSLQEDGIHDGVLYELLVLLHVYTNWESLEGGPYCKMRDVHYPFIRSDSSNSGYPSATLLSKYLEYLHSAENPVFPELIGSLDSLAISNVNSIQKQLKAILLKEMEENSSTGSMVLFSLGILRSDGVWAPLRSTTNAQLERPRSFYEEAITITAALRDSFKSNRLTWKGEPADFTLTLDENGLGVDSEVTPEMIAASEVDPELVRIIAQNYLKRIKEFSFFKQIYHEA